MSQYEDKKTIRSNIFSVNGQEKIYSSESMIKLSILAKQKEKRRQLSIIVHDIIESDDEDPSAIKTSDIKEATSLFKE